jgi:hypothetical protein
MSTQRSILAILAAPLLLLAAVHARPAAAETTVCTQISSLPTTISAPGHYCLHNNFAGDYATAAININSSAVELDCNGYAVTQVGANVVAGVYVKNKNQVTVRNCVLVGFGRGIGFFETASGQSRNNRVIGNAIRRAKTAAIIMEGSYNLVAGNHISENRAVGGVGTAYTYGILVSSYGDGVGNELRDNTITGFAPSVSTYVVGIELDFAGGTVIEGNRIDSLYATETTAAYGIFGSYYAVDTVLVGNTIIAAKGAPPGGGGGLTYGGENLHGALFSAPPTTASHNVCRNNQVGHWTTDIAAEVLGDKGCLKMDNLEF